MAEKNRHTAELVKLAANVPALIDDLEGKITDVAGRMEALKKAGLIYATEHWRKGSDGEPKYLYLLYPQQPNEPRRREYVGREVGRIEEARAGIVRAGDYDKLAAHYSALADRARRVADALGDARRYLVAN
jgi:hypothetical protein